MNAAARSLLATCGLFVLAACGSSPAPEPTADTQDDAAAELGRDTDETVFDDMIETQDDARAVENLTLGRKGDIDQAMDAATGDAPVDEE